MQALTRAGIGDTCTIKWMLVNREIRDFMESPEYFGGKRDTDYPKNLRRHG